MKLKDFVKAMPKAELHVHIEGTLEPQMLLDLAARHAIDIPYKSLGDVEKAYAFDNLQSFLDIYYAGASVLLNEQDFFDLMFAYLQKCREQNIVHTEMMFDPQTHLERGISFETMFNGYYSAIEQARKEWGQSASLIMCFLRHLSADSAMDVLKQAEPFRDKILTVGLDSSELGHPPEKFEAVYAEAIKQGYRSVAHAGEEGDPSYIWGALDLLKVERVDHGVRCLEDQALVKRLIDEEMPLTVCPLSNIRLCVYQSLDQHPILNMLDQGIRVTVNSDDPPYFGGYLNDNLVAMVDELDMTEDQARALALNSFRGSFVDDAQKAVWISELASFH
ncbi:MAG: adenosine deaminase [Candidatus Azotimanducaceae bacterium]|jgi:adenosine deaminase